MLEAHSGIEHRSNILQEADIETFIESHISQPNCEPLWSRLYSVQNEVAAYPTRRYIGGGV